MGKLFRMEKHTESKRVWELDLLRGTALLLMTYFHIIYDMKDIFNYGISYDSGVNYLVGKTSAVLFIVISGISCSFSSSNLKRGLKLLVLGMLITLATHLYNPVYGVKFGILHFLGVCMLMFPVFQRLNSYLLIGIGTVLFFAGRLISMIHVSHDYFFILGIYSDKFISSDYYPFIPWLGVFLYGTAIGKILYKEKKSLFKFALRDNPVSMAGRYSLLYYLVHQPVIIGLLALIQWIV